jgi:hypothetical protein
MAWKVPRLWEGGECWILGGGPSLPRQFGVPEDVIQAVYDKKMPLDAYSPYMASIHDKHVIGVNQAFMIGDWIDIVFWGDKKWYLQNRQSLGKFPGLKMTCHPYFANGRFDQENIKCVLKDNQKPMGISSDPAKSSWNSNSGAAAISVAANMGATKIILVGFDMKLDESNRQHWHAEYGTAKRENMDSRKLPFSRHLAGFAQIAKDAKVRGIIIINACPDSEIKELPKMSVKDILKGSPIPIVKNVQKVEKGRSPKPRVKRIADGFKVMEPFEPGKRFDWLAKIIRDRQYSVGAEVGVARGNLTKTVLARNPQLHMYAVDLWAPMPEGVDGGKQYKLWDFTNIKKRFDEQTSPFRSRLTVLHGISWEISDQVEDNSLDFVFLDADHEYESVIKDIQAWTPKLKPNGMMSGHDTHFDSVAKAIDELIPKHIKVGIDHCWEAKKEDVLL